MLATGVVLTGCSFTSVHAMTNEDVVATQSLMNQNTDLSQHNGFLLDVARHPISYDQVKTLIRKMNPDRYQYMVLHLNDNEGCMFKSDLIGNMDQANGFTQSQLKQLVSYANQYGIQLVFDFDLPAHCEALCNDLRDSQPDLADQIVNDDDTLNYNSNEMRDWVAQIYNQLNDAYGNQSQHYIIMGGDEVPGGISNNQALVGYFNHMDNIAKDNGYRTIIWNDNLAKNNQLHSDIIVAYWSQSGDTDSNLSTLKNQRVSANDVVNTNHEIINANSFYNYYQMSNLDDNDSVDWFLDHFKSHDPNRFQQISRNNTNQDIMLRSRQPKGQLVALWGEDSNNISFTDIKNFVWNLNHE